MPVTEYNPKKSKKGLYFLNDNFITFWFRFVYPYRSYIESGNYEYVLKKLEREFVSNHVSKVFEEICRERIIELVKNEKILLTKVGRWWDRDTEIDIVGINDETGDMLLVECRYTSKPVNVDVLFELQKKSEKITWRKGERKERFVICGGSGFTKELLELKKKRKDLLLLDFQGYI